MKYWETITDWHRLSRYATVDFMLANLHEYSVDDVAFAQDSFNMTFEEHEDIYKSEAVRSLIVYSPERLPMYLVVVGESGFVSTLLHKSYEGRKLHLTKQLLRMSRTSEGKAFLRGTHSSGDVRDIESNVFSSPWVGRIGYQYCETVPAYGTEFARYAYVEN